MRKLFLTLSVLFFLLVTGFSQNRIITGKITDDQGSPLSNASVTVKNSSVGTTTGTDGSFRLSVPATARTLVFSSVGFELREVAIGNQREISVSLRVQDQSMEEVVIVAYGQQKRESVT